MITKTTSFAISPCGPRIWINYLHEFAKNNLSLSLFLHKLKIKLLESEDEINFFLTEQIAIDLDIIFYVLLYDRNI